MFSLTFRSLLRAHALLLLAVVLPAWSAIDPNLTADDSQGRVYLADGSVLVGEVTAIRGGEVTIKTTFTDADIQVPVALVQAFDRSAPTDLMLVDQNTLALETVTVREGQVQLDDKAIPLTKGTALKELEMDRLLLVDLIDETREEIKEEESE